MANRVDFDNYIMACVKKYEEKHPEDRFVVKKNIKVPVEGCKVCRSEDDLYNIPFYQSVSVENGELVVVNEDTIKIKIHYCPICGRKLAV